MKEDKKLKRREQDERKVGKKIKKGESKMSGICESKSEKQKQRARRRDEESSFFFFELETI